MKILLISIGSRGDIEPLLAIVDILKEKNHEVIGVFPEQFKQLTEDAGIDFRSLGSEFLQLLDSETGKQVMGSDCSGFKKFLSYIALAKLSLPIHKDLILKQHKIVTEEAPDFIIHNSKAVYALLWSIRHPNQTLHLSPIPRLIHVVKNYPHVGFGQKNLGSFINSLTYKLANFGIIQTARQAKKWLKLPEKITSAQIKQALLEESMVYCVSPSLFPRPDYWPYHVQILGYRERNKTHTWQPDADLKQFLEQHDKILFLTFGSMTNPHPAEKTKLFLDLLGKHNIPTIINTSVGGLIKPETFNKSLFYFVEQIPYDWIFPKIYAVIHHGGSGTTHMGLRYGCPSMIVPHIIDQFLWNDVVADLGAGPKGDAIGKLEKSKLESDIIDLWQNQAYKRKTQRVAEIMGSEDFKHNLYKFLTQTEV